MKNLDGAKNVIEAPRHAGAKYIYICAYILKIYSYSYRWTDRKIYTYIYLVNSTEDEEF